MPIEKFVTKEGDKSQECFILATAEEMVDRSHMEYLKEAEQVKFSEQTKNATPKPTPKYGRDHSVEAVKELHEYREWHRKNPNSKRYF